jgi:hypothetical protein
MAHRSRSEQWRAKAEELRVIAEGVGHDGSRATLLGLAEQYERLARRAAALPLGGADEEEKAS